MSPDKPLKQTTQETPLSEGELQDQARIDLGIKLRTTRENNKISLTDASSHLRIHCAYLQGLENGDWSELPEEVYVMGFLRQYATLLGIDINEEIKALKPSEYRLTKPFTMPDPPIAMSRGWAIAAGTAFLLLLILFNVVDEEKEEITPLQTTQNITAGSQASQQPAPPPSSVPDVKIAMPPTSVANTRTLAMPPPNVAQTQPVINEKKTSTLPEAAPLEINQIEPATQQAAANAKASFTKHRFLLTAKNQDVWLQLHTPNGTLVKEALLRAGEKLSVISSEAHLLLTSGNPLALRISIDGQLLVKSGTLGKKDTVLRDYLLQLPTATTGNTP